jgi:hypothetical protein
MMKDDRHAVLLARWRDGACDAATLLLLPAGGDRVRARGTFRKLKVAAQTLRSCPPARYLRDERANCDPSSHAGRGEGHATCNRPAQAGAGKVNGAVTGQRRLNRQTKP